LTSHKRSDRERNKRHPVLRGLNGKAEDRRQEEKMYPSIATKQAGRTVRLAHNKHGTHLLKNVKAPFSKRFSVWLSVCSLMEKVNHECPARNSLNRMSLRGPYMVMCELRATLISRCLLSDQ
jgi:hypothetical protein